MPPPHNFEHLPLILSYHGDARLSGGGDVSQQTRDNRNEPRQHSATLRRSAESLGVTWTELQSQRQQENLPPIPEGVPFLLQIDPGLDLDDLRRKFEFEIVAEEEQGYVIVAAKGIDLTAFLEMVENFAGGVYGSAAIAQVHRLYENPSDRLPHILSANLFVEWPNIADNHVYIVDVGIACVGTKEIPTLPKKGKLDTDAKWAKKEHDWSQARIEAYDEWDRLKQVRETEIEQFADSYQAELLHVIHGDTVSEAVLPDSFTVRLQIVGL